MPEQLPNWSCALCGDNGPDMRHMTIECWADVSEYIPVMTQKTIQVQTGEESIFPLFQQRTGWTMNVCKSCRSRLLTALRKESESIMVEHSKHCEKCGSILGIGSSICSRCYCTVS